MRNLLFVILTLMTTIIFSSCNNERFIYIDDIPINPHVVLNGVIYAGSDTSYFYITKSRPIYNNNDSIWNGSQMNTVGYEMIDNADFNLTVNQQPYFVEYSKADSAYTFTNKLKEGDNIDIEIIHKNERITSGAVLPPPPQVISIDTVSVKRVEYGYPRNYLKFDIKIKDNPGRKDYYRLVISGVTYSLENNQIRYFDNFVSYYSNDPVLTNGYTGASSNSDILIQSSRYNSFSVFRDVMFADKEYILTFYVQNEKRYNYPGYEYLYECRMNIKLQSINEDLYKYYSSLQYNLQSSWEPVKVHTNINGGLGILGVCNEIKIFEDLYQY